MVAAAVQYGTGSVHAVRLCAQFGRRLCGGSTEHRQQCCGAVCRSAGDSGTDGGGPDGNADGDRCADGTADGGGNGGSRGFSGPGGDCDCRGNECGGDYGQQRIQRRYRECRCAHRRVPGGNDAFHHARYRAAGCRRGEQCRRTDLDGYADAGAGDNV